MISSTPRFIGALLLSVIATLFTLFALAETFGAAERVAKDRVYLACFMQARAQAEASIRTDQPLPQTIEFRPESPDQTPRCQPIAVNADPIESGLEAFTAAKRPKGGYTLSFWRGEWFEYYASWSNKTTLLTDTGTYYRSFASEIAISWLIAIAAIWGAWRLIRPLFKRPATA